MGSKNDAYLYLYATQSFEPEYSIAKNIYVNGTT